MYCKWLAQKSKERSLQFGDSFCHVSDNEGLYARLNSLLSIGVCQKIWSTIVGRWLSRTLSAWPFCICFRMTQPKNICSEILYVLFAIFPSIQSGLSLLYYHVAWLYFLLTFLTSSGYLRIMRTVVFGLLYLKFRRFRVLASYCMKYTYISGFGASHPLYT